MVFWEHETELFLFLSLTEGTNVVVNLMDNDIWEAEDERKCALNDEVDSWDWLCLWIFPMSFPMTNSR